MPRRVKGPDGVVHTFPDDATDDEISGALDRRQAPTPNAPRPRTWTDTAVDALPAVGGAIGGIVGGIGGTVLGMGVGGVPGAIGGATVGGGAGEAARQLVNRARGVDAPTSPLAAASDIATRGGIEGATEAVGGGITRGIGMLGQAVYRGYLKPSLAATDIGKAREIVATGLRENLAITKGGEARAARIIGQLNAQVEKELRASNGTVDLVKIADRVRDFAKRTYQRPGVPTTDFDAAMKVADEIDQHPSLGLPVGAAPSRVDVKAVQANQAKQGLDRAIGDTGFGVERNAATQARKVGRHAAREAIEAKVPGVGKLNQRESEVIGAMEAITKAAAREENKNPLTGVSTLLALGGVGGGAYSQSGDPFMAATAALTARGLLEPAVATRAAILAAKFGQSKFGPVTAATALRMGVVMALRESERDQQ